MSDRLGLAEMTSFVAAVIQSEMLGVSMAKVLRIQSDQMRVKRRQHAEEEAHKAPIKMIFPMGLFIFPCLDDRFANSCRSSALRIIEVFRVRLADRACHRHIGYTNGCGVVWTGFFHQSAGDVTGQDSAGVRIVSKRFRLFRNLSVEPAVCRLLILGTMSNL